MQKDSEHNSTLDRYDVIQKLHEDKLVKVYIALD